MCFMEDFIILKALIMHLVGIFINNHVTKVLKSFYINKINLLEPKYKQSKIISLI